MREEESFYASSRMSLEQKQTHRTEPLGIISPMEIRLRYLTKT